MRHDRNHLDNLMLAQKLHFVRLMVNHGIGVLDKNGTFQFLGLF